MVGGAIAGFGGASLSLYYPGSWNEGLSSGQGLIAVALVILRAGTPGVAWARLLPSAARGHRAGAAVVGVSGGYYLFNAMPYVLTLIILVATCSTSQSLRARRWNLECPDERTGGLNKSPNGVVIGSRSCSCRWWRRPPSSRPRPSASAGWWARRGATSGPWTRRLPRVRCTASP